MKRLFQLDSIRKKIMFSFSIVLVLVFLLGGYNYLAIKALNSNTSEIVDQQLPLLISDEKIALDMAERTSLARGYLLYGDPEVEEGIDNSIEASIQLEEEILKQSNSEKVKQLMEKRGIWGEKLNQVFEQYDTGNKEKAMKIMTDEVKPLEDEILSGFKEMTSLRETAIAKTGKMTKNYGRVSLGIDIAITILVFYLLLLCRSKLLELSQNLLML
ncbi:CHASE3 domain-containing protein [Paracerasibacillus soli]|uniref:MCP four helix bundle domain-containing protein n=1 Tax=Paracerasibacillus soli TaxID=480284 RepID=A0ABU5CM78_9BACI|nr:MCP four helix bundle domain-containing protein [Virgibacillus soli]MDY0407463.1 MCP four helix bundle domain-containing protein [Virgibacillus soli]